MPDQARHDDGGTARALVYRAAILAGEQDDHPLDLPPAAEVHDIADIAAVRCPRRGFVSRMDAEAGDQIGGIARRRPIGQVNMV